MKNFIFFIFSFTFFISCSKNNLCQRDDDCPQSSICFKNKCIKSEPGYCINNNNCSFGYVCLDEINKCVSLKELNSIKSEEINLNEDIKNLESITIKNEISIETNEKDIILDISADKYQEVIPKDIIKEKDSLTQTITWENTVKKIFYDHCIKCHPDMKTYNGVIYYIEKGTMKKYVENYHYIYGEDREKVLLWIELGYPEK